MSQQRRQKVEFTADKKISKPVKVEFYTKDGEKVFCWVASVSKRRYGGSVPFKMDSRFVQ